MIYDKPITVCRLPDGVDAITKTKTLTPVFSAYCGELEVYHRRYWESVQAGSRIDRMVRVPFGEALTATQYAIPEDGHVYRIEQAQHGLDEDGLAVTTLSLRRMEGSYDILRAEDST